uniref:Conodipine n=1 Tax=Conus ermineus TaxID=55423 RepID=A0A346CIH6_CONER|nr:conodipine [Conus ermineus]
MKLLAPVLWAMAALGVTWLVAVDSISEQSCKRYSDGCSTRVPLPCKEYFRPACDKHDSCYRCGKTFEISREQCDEAFYVDMTTLCDERGFFGMCPARRKRGVTSRRATSIAHARLWKKALHQRSFLNRKARLFFVPLTLCQDWAVKYQTAVKWAGASSYSETTYGSSCKGLRHCLPNH